MNLHTSLRTKHGHFRGVTVSLFSVLAFLSGIAMHRFGSSCHGVAEAGSIVLGVADAAADCQMMCLTGQPGTDLFNYEHPSIPQMIPPVKANLVRHSGMSDPETTCPQCDEYFKAAHALRKYIELNAEWCW